MPKGRLTLALFIVVALALALPTGENASSVARTIDERPGAVATRALAFALLADNRLAAISLASGTVVALKGLGPPPPSGAHGEWWRSADGHYLALSNDGRTLFAIVPGLVPGRPTGIDHLAVIDAATVRVRAIYPLPPALAFHSLAVGQRTGRLYLFGNRPVGGPLGTSPADAIVTVRDPSGRTMLANWTARKAQGHNYFAYRGLVSSDERKLFISYHGFDTTGVDLFTLSRSGLSRCHSSFGPRDGCIPGHGNAELNGNGLLVSQGNGPIDEIGATGRVRRTLDTHLDRNHLLEFTVDRRVGRLYAVGSCIYVGGFSVVDIRTGRVQVLVPLPNYHICGERLALASHSLLVLAKTHGVIPQIGVQGQVLFLDTRTGRVLRSIPTPAEPVDVLVSAAS
jgi:hypothetical protein